MGPLRCAQACKIQERGPFYFCRRLVCPTTDNVHLHEEPIDIARRLSSSTHFFLWAADAWIPAL
eukprot:2322313-Pyramimonas_sp.AAC.1